MKSITVNLPEQLYQRLEKLAEATGLSLNEVVVQLLTISLSRPADLSLPASPMSELPESGQTT